MAPFQLIHFMTIRIKPGGAIIAHNSRAAAYLQQSLRAVAATQLRLLQMISLHCPRVVKSIPFSRVVCLRACGAARDLDRARLKDGSETAQRFSRMLKY